MGVNDGVCKQENCAGNAQAKGWCSRHYYRWKRYGDPEAPKPKRVFVPSECSVEECVKPVEARGLCGRHYSRYMQHGDPHYVYVAATYQTVHRRLKRVRGSALDQACMFCERQAQDWAYDHLDPKEQHGLKHGRKVPMAFSLDLQHYVPVCGTCHVAWDRLTKLKQDLGPSFRECLSRLMEMVEMPDHPFSEDPDSPNLDRGASCRTGCKTKDHGSYAECLRSADFQIGNLK